MLAQTAIDQRADSDDRERKMIRTFCLSVSSSLITVVVEPRCWSPCGSQAYRLPAAEQPIIACAASWLWVWLLS